MLSVLAGGFGIGLYAVAWLLMPGEEETESIGKRALNDSRGIALSIAILPVLVAIIVVGEALSVPILDSVAVPLLVSPPCLILIWRNSGPDEKALLRRGVAPFLLLTEQGAGAHPARRMAARIAVAAALALGGLGLVLADHPRHFTPILAGLTLFVAAIVLLFGPWWLRLARELVVERQARARAEERAEIASRVHDSVLQTLALIQRRADQPQQVVQLARAQERELRSWLFGGEVPVSGADAMSDKTFAAGIRRIQEEVEALHGMPVEAVVVGDCELDEGLRAMLAAGKEAAVNAAKWSGAPTVSLFGEIEATGMVWLFVRDRGVGFVPDDVAADRKGLAQSVRGRMARNGGSVDIRSAPGRGTEVALSMASDVASRKAVPQT